MMQDNSVGPALFHDQASIKSWGSWSNTSMEVKTALFSINDDRDWSNDLSACHSTSLSKDWWEIYFLIASHFATGTFIFSNCSPSVSLLFSIFCFIALVFSTPSVPRLLRETWLCIRLSASHIARLIGKPHRVSWRTLWKKVCRGGPEFWSLASDNLFLTHPLCLSISAPVFSAPHKPIIQPRKLQSLQGNVFYRCHFPRFRTVQQESPPGPFN